MVEENVNEAIQMDYVLRKRTVRNFSFLGKILITKMYGISQVIYVLQSLALDDKHFRKINQLQALWCFKGSVKCT